MYRLLRSCVLLPSLHDCHYAKANKEVIQKVFYPLQKASRDDGENKGSLERWI